MTLGEFELEDSLGPHCRDSRRQADSKCAGSVIRGLEGTELKATSGKLEGGIRRQWFKEETIQNQRDNDDKRASVGSGVGREESESEREREREGEVWWGRCVLLPCWDDAE